MTCRMHNCQNLLEHNKEFGFDTIRIRYGYRGSYGMENETEKWWIERVNDTEVNDFVLMETFTNISHCPFCGRKLK